MKRTVVFASLIMASAFAVAQTNPTYNPQITDNSIPAIANYSVDHTPSAQINEGNPIVEDQASQLNEPNYHAVKDASPDRIDSQEYTNPNIGNSNNLEPSSNA